MVFDAVFLFRIQFAGSIVRHFLLPTLTIGHVSFIDIHTAWSCWVFCGRGRADVGYH
jgi:cytochrome bd-type quinol oxidase subunit 1